jgi:hypothetical protein
MIGSKAQRLPETMAERFTIIDYIGHVALVAEVFMDATVPTIGEVRYIVDPGDAAGASLGCSGSSSRGRQIMPRLPVAVAGAATPWQLISLAKRTGFAARNPEAGRLVHLLKDLPTDNQHTNVPGAGCVTAT